MGSRHIRDRYLIDTTNDIKGLLKEIVDLDLVI